jgi:hypothetical protein
MRARHMLACKLHLAYIKCIHKPAIAAPCSYLRSQFGSVFTAIQIRWARVGGGGEQRKDAAARSAAVSDVVTPQFSAVISCLLYNYTTL